MCVLGYLTVRNYSSKIFKMPATKLYLEYFYLIYVTCLVLDGTIFVTINKDNEYIYIYI